MPSLAHRRGTRAQIDAAASSSQLRAGEVYLITDEARLTVGTAINAHEPAAKQSEAGGGGSDPWTWQKLVADVANSTTTLAAVTGLSFTSSANSSYLIKVYGALQSAATTTGAALAVDIPSGSVVGQAQISSSATAAQVTEQIADNATTGVTTGVRAATTNVPFYAWFRVDIGATGGTVQLQFRSEVAGSAVTLKAGLSAMGRRTI
ncbi:hypothetical protein DXH95_01125 [Sphingorhabdus pulchriflava]|uniref:Major tropism determinant N-terminal domain-containing protein n=1 Tax=Sphingorhabdus pulchriflava TaxID=2292257 RepID=A0A371BEQ1_9SPHN|nr:hypothetical protein [Sphingorhabdus pulchriflava]RDV06079.1 hypothetical protein DXH95_01125 [Sphingorhabdus pulchriflava]